MTSPLTITAPDDTALGVIEFSINRGVPSVHVEVKIKNTGGVAVSGAYVAMLVETAAGSGIYSASVHPATLERMGRFQITSVDSSGTAGQQAVINQIQPMGHLATAGLPSLLPGNSIFADVWLEQDQNSVSGGDFNVIFDVPDPSKARPLPEGVSEIASGILTGLKQPRTFFVSGRDATATGTPDDDVHISAGTLLYNGAENTRSADTLTFDQDDFNGDPLAVGEKYIAAIYQQTGAPAVLKGVKSATPVKPATGILPIIAWITVNYSATTTVISNSDIEKDITYGRLLVTAPATGLTATVGTGESIAEGFIQMNALRQIVNLTASSTNVIWMKVTGDLLVNGGVVPSPGAHKLATLVTDLTHVTSLIDNRTFIGQTAATVDLHAPSHAAGGGDAVPLNSLAPAADLAMAGFKITGAGTPTASTDVATKGYVDTNTGSGNASFSKSIAISMGIG